MDEEKIVEVVNQPELQARIKIMKTGVFGEYSFKGENKAELKKAGAEAAEIFKEHLEKWRK